MERAGSLLSPLLKRLGIDEDVRLARIRNDWPNLFDKPLSLHMSPSRLLEGDLLLSVDSPAWIQQLGFYKKEIIGKLSSYGVRGVRFRIGRIAPGDRREAPRQQVPELSPEDGLFISEVVSSLNDEALRETICRALEKALCTAKLRK